MATARLNQVRVLFVCLGNICRSPTAQGVFEKLVRDSGLSELIKVDSAGCSDWHCGEPPDPRSIDAAEKRGIDLSSQRARAVAIHDFTSFHYIIGMDQRNMDYLLEMKPADSKATVRPFLTFAPKLGISDVPDPYHGGAQGFERVLDMIEVAALGLLQEITEKLDGQS